MSCSILGFSRMTVGVTGLALLPFRNRVEVDPFGALWDWGGTENHCFWFGVACSDGKVVNL